MLSLIKNTRKGDAAESPEPAAAETQPPVPAAAPGNELAPELAKALSELLMPYLGPVANHLVRSVANSCSTLEELARALSYRIPDGTERIAFLHAIETSGVRTLPFSNHAKAMEENHAVTDDSEREPETDHETVHEALFTPEQLSELTQALAYYIGPLASRLVKANKGKVNSIEELYGTVAKAISDPDDWAEFLMTWRKDP